jgi:hypothetical protein
VDVAVADAAKNLACTAGLLLLLTGCVSGDRHTWFYKSATEAALPGPIAVWGRPETTADAGFNCTAERRIEFWLGGEEPMTAGTSVWFRAGKARDRLTERFEDDGAGSAVFAIPAASPLLVAISGGAPVLQWRLDGRRNWFSLPLGEPVRRLLAQCSGTGPNT